MQFLSHKFAYEGSEAPIADESSKPQNLQFQTENYDRFL